MNATELKQAMSRLPVPETSLQPPFWEYWRQELWHLAQNDDPENFMQWPCIRHTMLVNHWSMAEEFAYLQSDMERWGNVIMPHVGYPVDYFNGTPFSANMINQAYHLKLWGDKSGKRIEDLDTIVEFGGGYGAMALLCYRLGFRGTYTVYDLLEFSLLQQWFLSEMRVDNVIWRPLPVEYIEADLLIALYSLSETPVKDRTRFLDAIEACSYLFLYSPTWESYDNLSYFQQLRGKVKREWWSGMTPRKTDWYLVGW